ncbi:MAG: fasciclin domain-containing protein [Nocardioides sp.]
MRIRTAATALMATALLTAGAAAPAPVQAAEKRLGNRSLATVLTSDGNRFDRNPRDYDIVTEAVLAVLAAKPDSPVGVLADGKTPVTAFIPNDWSFKRLVKDLTGTKPRSEKATFNALVAAVGVDAIEQVLLYHVVPGVTIDKRTAVRSDGASLTTAQGGAITVDVIYRRLPLVQLGDLDPDATDPFLDPFALDINKGNKQIAHGIYLVLRPLDL